MKPLILVALLLIATLSVPSSAAADPEDDSICTSNSYGGTPGITLYSGTFPGCWAVQYRILPPMYCPGGPEDNTLCQGTIYLS